MNPTYAALVFITVALAGVGPFVAVHRGGAAYDFPDETDPEPAPDEPNDDTTQLPRVTDDPYMY
jgi:hypothetical protein